ncbi:MAG: DnaB-like helicase C-terminal domain-containing protein [Lysinibacillus sp.]
MKDINMELVEKSVLATMLQENYLITDSVIRETHFTTLIHRNIYKSMRQLTLDNKAIDYITLLTMREPSEFGGANYLRDLKDYNNPENFDQYAEILLENWREGEKKNILLQAQVKNWDIGKIQKELSMINESDTTLSTSIDDYLVSIGNLPYEQSIERKGVPTGLNELEIMTNGFQPSELTIIAARPSMGKTDTMNHFVLTAGWAGYLPIVFSIEMSKELLVNRMIATTGNFNRTKMRDPFKYFSTEQKEKWLPALTRVHQAKVEVDERAGVTTADIKASTRRIIKSNPGKKPIIFIDYLQIIKPDRSRGGSRTEEVGQISWDLKQMAKEFKCPVVCLSQLSRGTEGRENKRPMMSELRDSGNIEQDADVIAFLYRDDYYNKESQSKGLLEIITAKNRNGPTGTVTVKYVKETGSLINVNWDMRNSAAVTG